MPRANHPHRDHLRKVPQGLAAVSLRSARARLARALRGPGGLRLRPRSFWAGWGGWVITSVIGGTVVALLVGWVLLWVSRPEGPSIALLTLGCVAFTLVLALLATLQNRLQAHWRLRQLEALLLAGVSHDLRTPISAMRAAAQALATESLDARQRDALTRAIVRETRRLGLRVDNLLETGRLELERQAFQFVRLDFSELVRKTLRDAEPAIVDLDGELAADIATELRIDGDARMLQLLIDNLLDNAIINADGGPRIAARLAAVADRVVLRIQDCGRGFADEEAPLLFRRFHRGRGTGSGAGLGLALARAIARGHGGDVQLRSAGPGLGAVAAVDLPLAGED